MDMDDFNINDCKSTCVLTCVFERTLIRWRRACARWLVAVTFCLVLNEAIQEDLEKEEESEEIGKFHFIAAAACY